MSKKIVSVLHPFDKMQNVFVYEDDNLIDNSQVDMEEIPNTILDFSAMYDITEVNLLGSKQFNKGMSKRIKQIEMDKYENNNLQINIE